MQLLGPVGFPGTGVRPLCVFYYGYWKEVLIFFFFYQESKQFRCMPFLQSPKSMSAIDEAGPALLRLQYPKEDLMSATHSGHFSMAYPMVAQGSSRHKKTCHFITHSSGHWCTRQETIHPWGTLLGGSRQKGRLDSFPTMPLP